MFFCKNIRNCSKKCIKKAINFGDCKVMLNQGTVVKHADWMAISGDKAVAGNPLPHENYNGFF